MKTVTLAGIVDVIKKLVALRSVAGNTAAQRACLVQLAAIFDDVLSAKFYRLNGRPALVLSTHRQKESTLIISGHIDVVEANAEMFVMNKDTKKLYGRGVYDMKGPLVASLFGIRDAVRAGACGRCTALITTDEELDGRSTALLLSKKGYTGNFALIPDGGDETHLVLAQKGFLQLEVIFHGVSSHAAYPWEGKNPIETLTKFLQMLSRRYPTPRSTEKWRITAVPTKISAGSVLNQIPSSATVCLDIRYISPTNPQTITSWIQRTFRNTARVNVIRGNGIFYTDEKNPYVHALQRVLKTHTGTTPMFMRESGTSDAVFFTEHKIPSVLLRPQGGGAHADSEWVSIKSLQTIYRVVYDYMLGIS